MDGAAAIGHHLRAAGGNAYVRPGEIRGIVGDARETGLDREPPPTVYWCDNGMQPGTLLPGPDARRTEVHGRGRSAARFTNSNPAGRSTTSHRWPTTFPTAYAENRLRTILLAFFAVTAVSLACVGLYGTLSYLVNLRRREVGAAPGVGSHAHASRAAVPGPGSAQFGARMYRRPAAGSRIRVIAIGDAVRCNGHRRGHGHRCRGHRAGGIGDRVAGTGRSCGSRGAHAGAARGVDASCASRQRVCIGGRRDERCAAS